MTTPNTITIAQIAEMARENKDNMRSMKLFNKTIDTYVADTYGQAVTKSVNSVLLTAGFNANKMCEAASKLLKSTDEFEDIDNMSTALLYTLGTAEKTPNDTTRDLVWTLIHQRQRRQAFNLMLDGHNHEKKMMRLSSRVRQMFKVLHLAQYSSRGKEVVAQAITVGLGNALLSKIDRDNLGTKGVYTVILILLNELSDQGLLLKMRAGRNPNTGATTHNITINLVLPDEIKTKLGRCMVRGVAYAEVKDFVEGKTYKLVSKNSWRDYKDFPLTKEMAHVMNIRNQMPLSVNQEYCTANLYEGLRDKLQGSDRGIAFKEWMHTAINDGIDEYKDIIGLGNKFYITHFLDRVCRVYEKSEYVGLGQTGSLRHMIELYNKIKLSPKGRVAIKRQIAAQEGFDKVSVEEMDIAYENHNKEWRDAGKYTREFALLRSKKPEGYLVELDAQNSGSQMYAVGMRSRHMAAMVGLYDLTERLDVYIELMKRLNENLGVDVFTRSNVKSIFMTTLYNAGKHLMLWGNGKDVDEDGYDVIEMVAEAKGKLEPLMLTLEGMGISEDDAFAAYKKAMWDIAPEAMKMMKKLNSLIDDRLVYEWVMPDGAFCQVAMTTTQEHTIQWRDTKNKKHEMTFSEKILQAEGKASALTPSIIQAIDAFVLRRVIEKADAEGIEVVTLHDAYFVHPNNVERIGVIYKEIMCDVMEMDLLTNIYNQLSHTPIKSLQTQGDTRLTSEDIMNTKYSIWF
jgi:hypothetical protein